MILFMQDSALDVWDVEPLSVMRQISVIGLQGVAANTARIQIFGHRAFLSGSGRMAVVDLHRPKRPKVVGGVRLQPFFSDIPDVFEGMVFVGGWFDSDEGITNSSFSWRKVSRRR